MEGHDAEVEGGGGGAPGDEGEEAADELPGDGEDVVDGDGEADEGCGEDEVRAEAVAEHLGDGIGGEEEGEAGGCAAHAEPP